MEPTSETEEALNQLAREGNSDVAAALLIMGERAKEIAPEVVGLSLTLLEDALTFTLVASSEEAAILDAVQYVDGGPCEADLVLEEPLETRSGDLLDERRWLLYAKATAAAGVGSSLSLPIMREGRVIGGVNLYAATPDAFEGRHADLAKALGASAEAAVSNADLTFSTRRLAAETPTRLTDQRDIDDAAGIIAEHQGVAPATARERLRRAAARAGITEAQAARAVKHLQDP